MSVISKEEVGRVADLARLTFTEEEKEVYTRQLNDILTFVKKLDEVDTTNVPPTSHVIDVHNVLREDKVRPSLPVEEVLKNVPEHVDNQVKVPSIIGE